MNRALPQLFPGDHLLYNTRGDLADWIVRVKTWSKVAHIEVYAGDGMSMAARRNGVNLYPFRPEGLRFVLRPRFAWYEVRAKDWFKTSAQGQKYDWLGLLCFTLAVAQGSPGRMFCSEFARNLCRAACCPAFADDWPGDLTSPGMFLSSPAFTKVYDSTASRLQPEHP